MSSNDFTRLMADPEFIEAERRERELAERKRRERLVRRGSHEPIDDAADENSEAGGAA